MSWSPSSRIPTSSVRIVVAGLNALGHPVCEPAEPTLPVSEVVALLERALELGGPAFGVLAGRAIPQGALGLVDHLCAAAPTGLEMLEDLERYFTLVASGVTLRLEAPSVVLQLPDALPERHGRLLAELVFSLLEARLAERGQARAVRVRFPWSVPDAAATTEAQWAEVEFGGADCRMTFTMGALRSPLETSNDSLRALLDTYATLELEQRPSVETTAQKVRTVLREALPGGAPSASEVARVLGLSDRSLRRALLAEGTRFSEVRDDTLRAVAEDALCDPERSIGEVAWLLGYSEPSAFHRAFRRWTGATPEGFRRTGQDRQ